MKTEIVPVKKNENVAREKKNAREKVWKTLKKSPWKDKFAREILQKIMPVKLKLMPVKKFGKIPRENMNFSAKSIKFVPVKEKKVDVKKLGKWAKKWAWNWFFAREKNQKNAKNRFSRALFFSREKKNTVYR